MTIYAVEVFHLIHTCPGNPGPHPIDIRRRIVHVTPGGPCRAPITFDNGVTIPCGRREPFARQCVACRTIVTTIRVTTRDLGYQRPAHLAPTPTEVTA